MVKRYTPSDQAEGFIRRTGGNWFQVVDVEGYTIASQTTIRHVIKRLVYINILESEKEGRSTKYRLKQSYLDRMAALEAV